MEAFRTITIWVFVLPVLGILFGGVYSIPASYLTKDRDPWFTMLLACGLGMTSFGIGLLAQAPLLLPLGVWGVGLVLLLIAHSVHGGLGHNLEHFGFVHVATLLLIAWSVLIRSIISRHA